MKKIAVAFFFLALGFFSLSLTEYLGESIFEIFVFSPFFVGIPLAIWGLSDKNK